MEEAFYTALIKTAFNGAKSIVRSIFKKKPLSFDEVKKQTRVLLIDNEPLQSLVHDINAAGWNAKQINEVENMDSEDLKNADIIFVDFKDVGQVLTPSEEGIGLLKLLKRKYPQKHFIFFSGFAGFIPGQEIHDIADGWIQKHADLHVYIERIEMAAKNIYGK